MSMRAPGQTRICSVLNDAKNRQAGWQDSKHMTKFTCMHSAGALHKSSPEVAVLARTAEFFNTQTSYYFSTTGHLPQHFTCQHQELGEPSGRRPWTQWSQKNGQDNTAQMRPVAVMPPSLRHKGGTTGLAAHIAIVLSVLRACFVLRAVYACMHTM
eukprot:1147333-Pelagomonas_calceolata.AAC.6